MSGCREALDKWAKAFDTESDEWQDMMVDRVYAQGWKDSRQALSSCSENPNRSATGNAVAMGDLTDEEGDLHKKSILIQFASVDDFHAARESGQCRFTVFGGDV